MALSPGTRLGHYEIIAPLGAGGMGEVYRARDTRLSREVAVKVLPAELSSDAERLKRFEREAQAASSLNHPNIVTIYEIQRLDAMPLIVMELVDGQTLRELLKAAAGPAPGAVRSEFRCRIVRGDQQITLSEGENLLGRDPAVTVWIDLASVSRRHARILVAGGTATIEDLGSRNGTSVRGRRISSPTKLESGDRIKVGATTLVFRRSRRLGTTESEVSPRTGGSTQRES